MKRERSHHSPFVNCAPTSSVARQSQWNFAQGHELVPAINAVHPQLRLDHGLHCFGEKRRANNDAVDQAPPGKLREEHHLIRFHRMVHLHLIAGQFASMAVQWQHLDDLGDTTDRLDFAAHRAAGWKVTGARQYAQFPLLSERAMLGRQQREMERGGNHMRNHPRIDHRDRLRCGLQPLDDVREFSSNLSIITVGNRRCRNPKAD